MRFWATLIWFLVLGNTICFALVPSSDYTIQKKIINAIVLISTQSEDKGLKKLQNLIKKDPREFKISYHKLFLDTNILKKDYNLFVDLDIKG